MSGKAKSTIFSGTGREANGAAGASGPPQGMGGSPRVGMVTAMLRHFAPSLTEEDDGIDPEAPLMIDEADEGAAAVAGGVVSFGLYTHSITVSDPDLDVIEDRPISIRSSETEECCIPMI